MDLVLGLSMTSSSVRWVLVEGTTGEGATLDRGSLPTDAPFDANALLSALLDKAAARRVHAIGLTWTSAAEATASAVWQALTDRQIENVIAVSDIEAAEALTCGIADIAGYDRVVVCVVEPGAAVVAAVTPDGVIADRVDAAALGDVDGLSPDAVFVVGSGDLDAVVAELHQRTQAPVVSADEADLALARGAALAAASAVAILDAQATPVRRHLSPTVTLAAVLAAAVVTFVVSLSVALGMTLTPEDEVPQMARSETPAREATPPSPAKAGPPAPQPAAPAPEAPAVAETIAVAVPVPEAAPMAEPPAAPPPEYQEPLAPAPAYIPPAPAYVPPAPPPNYLPPAPAPAYVPPVLPPPAVAPGVVPPVQEPRLRDRIIERIPIINRFHEPDPYG